MLFVALDSHRTPDTVAAIELQLVVDLFGHRDTSIDTMDTDPVGLFSMASGHPTL